MRLLLPLSGIAMTHMKRLTWIIFALFLLLRVVFASNLPIFNDESIYMRWGMGFLEHPEKWWAFMGDGKQPAVAIFFGLAQILPIEPIIAMRLVSILFSCITFWSVYVIAKTLVEYKKYSHSVFMIHYSLFMLTFSPFLIIYDSLALAESAVTACMTVAMVVCISFARRPMTWKGAFLGIVIGAGWWFKSSILLAVPMIGMMLLLFWKQCISQWRKMILGLAVGGIAGFVIAAPVLFNPNINYAHTMAAIPRTLTIKQVMSLPIKHWWINAQAVIQWFIGFGTPLVCLVFLASIYIYRRQKNIVALIAWGIVPMLIEIFLVTSLAARLFVYAMVPMTIVSSYALSEMRSKILPLVVLVSVVICGIIMAIAPTRYYALLKPLPAAQNDFSQYVSGWTSGYGVKEAVHRLKEEASVNMIVVFVRPDSGNPEDPVIAAMQKADIPIFYTSQIQDVLKISELNQLPWYFVSRGPQYAGLFPTLSEIAKFPKPYGDEFVGVYLINK